MAIVFGVLVGLALGLTGGGGSILAVPLLVYGLSVAPKDAVVVSLAAVGIAAAFGAIDAQRARLVEWRAGLMFASLGIVGAPLGLMIGERASDTFLTLGFAALALMVAAAMWRKARRPGETRLIRAGVRPDAAGGGAVCPYSPDGRLRINTRCGAMLCASGLGTGVIAGLFGVGGGFLIVPALAVVTQMTMHRAVATSLFVIAAVGLGGVAFEYLHGRVPPWQLTGLFVLGGLLGMGLGRLGAYRLAGPVLQRLFAAAVAMVAMLMIVTNLGVLVPFVTS